MLASIIWNVDPDIFTIGGHEIRWYGLLWGIGFLVGYFMVEKIFKHEKLPEAWLDKLFMYTIICSIVGARLGHCLFYEWDYFSQHPLEILFIWKGGLASHGGTLGLILGLIYYSKHISHKSTWWLTDRMIPAIAFACMCIRLGNLMNSEIFGHATTLPWGFEFVRSREWVTYYAGKACHPTQIYEMLYCLLAMIVGTAMYWKYHLEKRVGLITGVSLIIFFLSRFFIEFLKNPQEEFEQSMTLNMGQILSIPLILLGLYLAVSVIIKPDIKRLV